MAQCCSNYDGVYPYVSYVTGAGDEIVLSAPGLKKYWELYGREGFAAPELKTESRAYANGTSRILAAILQKRELKMRMVMQGATTIERDNLYRNIASRLIQVGSSDNWGRLKIQRSDGRFIYIDCVYTGGMNVSDTLPRIYEFDLEFEAGDAYFYDENETVLTSGILRTLFYLNDSLYLGNWTLTDGLTDIVIDNDGEVFYPVVEVTGPASVIRLTNNSTGQTLSLNPSFSLLAGDTLVIDCRENRRAITMIRDGVETDVTYELALGSSLIWPVAKGENTISFYYTNSNDQSSFLVRYQRRYFSI